MQINQQPKVYPQVPNYQSQPYQINKVQNFQPKYQQPYQQQIQAQPQYYQTNQRQNYQKEYIPQQQKQNVIYYQQQPNYGDYY